MMPGKINRNDPCLCGSGKKHKNCCGGKKTDTDIEFIDPMAAISTCAWCEKEISDDSEVFGLSAKAQPKLNIEKYAGKAFWLHLILSHKSVPVIIAANDSQAKKEGKDMLFSICSELCGKELETALNKEKELIKNLNISPSI